MQGSPGNVSLLPRRAGSTPSTNTPIKQQSSRRKEKHNENERKRREDLKMCYSSLAQCLPELAPFQQVYSSTCMVSRARCSPMYGV